MAAERGAARKAHTQATSASFVWQPTEIWLAS
jgi:hypothetical protein